MNMSAMKVLLRKKRVTPCFRERKLSKKHYIKKQSVTFSTKNIHIHLL
jgi:hypothetical protein